MRCCATNNPGVHHLNFNTVADRREQRERSRRISGSRIASKIPRPLAGEGKRRGGCCLFCNRRDAGEGAATDARQTNCWPAGRCRTGGNIAMNTYPIVDADAHMFEPPDLWTKRIDAPFRDRAPRIVEGLNGKKGLFFVCEGLPPFRVSGAFAAGQKFDRSFLETGMESAPAGGWDPAARLKDM